MPRPLPLLPSHHNHTPSGDNYSKFEKTKKPLPFLPHTRTPFPLLVISSLCLIVGVAGITFALAAVFRPIPVPTFRCGRVEDTFRGFYSLTENAKSVRPEHESGAATGGVVVVDRPKLVGFVGIQTGFSSRDRRDALRSTWFSSDADGLRRLEQATGLAFRFVIGRSKDAKKMAELEKEIEKYNDFMIIDFEEEYLKLPYKTLAFFKAAFELFEAEYYVKADDDIYLRPDRLATLLAKERTDPLTYIGCMKKGPVITDPKLKWFEKSGHLIGSEYFLHAYGPIYILSSAVVASLAATRNNSVKGKLQKSPMWFSLCGEDPNIYSLRMFNNEDVTVGSWMIALNVHHEDNRAICDPRCTPTSIAVWDIPKCSGLCNPAVRMKELHNISMCSASPTLPPDDR